ncbi:hypothetical protein BC567DRAFT_228515 [Phyllosticta citribraziliensis]
MCARGLALSFVVCIMSGIIVVERHGGKRWHCQRDVTERSCSCSTGDQIQITETIPPLILPTRRCSPLSLIYRKDGQRDRRHDALAPQPPMIQVSISPVPSVHAAEALCIPHLAAARSSPRLPIAPTRATEDKPRC